MPHTIPTNPFKNAEFASRVAKLKQTIFLEKTIGRLVQLLGVVCIGAGVGLLIDGTTQYAEAESIDEILVSVCDPSSDVDTMH